MTVARLSLGEEYPVERPTLECLGFFTASRNPSRLPRPREQSPEPVAHPHTHATSRGSYSSCGFSAPDTIASIPMIPRTAARSRRYMRPMQPPKSATDSSGDA